MKVATVGSKKRVSFYEMLVLVISDCFVPAEEFFLIGAKVFESFGKKGIGGGFGLEFFDPDVPFSVDSLYVAPHFIYLLQF
jgi:hypothetical protein